MAVVRIEFEDGYGLFRDHHVDKWNNCIEGGIIIDNFSNISIISNEFSHLNWSQYKCAFKSIEQFFEILSVGCMKHLEKHGAKFFLLEGEFIEGETQVIFKDENITMKKQVSIEKLQSFLNVHYNELDYHTMA